LKSLLAQLLRDEAGQDLVEYALLAALIATLSVVALNALGASLSQFYQKVNEVIPKG
jgi:Flp pilus assembly pilin Flp